MNLLHHWNFPCFLLYLFLTKSLLLAFISVSVPHLFVLLKLPQHLDIPIQYLTMHQSELELQLLHCQCCELDVQQLLILKYIRYLP